jgi:L-ascorbate metabolism protein UlaG (beta-lactamase superfamily)
LGRAPSFELDAFLHALQDHRIRQAHLRRVMWFGPGGGTMVVVTRDDERLTWVGHATVLFEVGGVRLLTDPLLRTRLGHLRRHGARPHPEVTKDIDAVLISHVHLDHLDLQSLRRLGRRVRAIAPRGAGRLLRRIGFAAVDEVVPGDSVTIGDAAVTALPAVHNARRHPLAATVTTLGYDIAGTQRVCFMGDTELFDGMRALAGRFDVALLPVWGWGPSLGPGHMDPLSAARAVALIRPAVAVPIHWGTFFPVGLERLRGSALVEPPRSFARHVADLAPAVEVRVLAPGDELVLAPATRT